MLSVAIKNGEGTTAKVSRDGELSVSVTSYPPLGEQKVQPLRRYLTQDGTVSGDFDMGVDGSTVNVDYCVPSDPNNDRYITSLNIIVGYGTSGQPNEWADATALANGSRLFYSNRHGEHDIHEGIKSNQDMFRLSFNAIPANWEVRHVNANNDFGYFISMDLTKMGLPFGIKLDAGSSQKFVMRIRDDATNADSFNCIAYGFERFK